MASEKEYDSFKTANGNVVELDLAVNEFGQWNDAYDLHPIFCPECGVAQLKFTSASSNRSAFLSSMSPPYPFHANDCSHRVKAVGKRAAKEFYDTCTPEQAMDKINACINLLKHRNFILAEGDGDKPAHRPRLTINCIINNHTESRRLRTRSFYSIYKLDDDDMGVPIVFYGRVLLSVVEKVSKNNKYKFNVLKVKSSRGDNKQLQSVFLGANTIEVEDNREYLFSMVGIAEKNNGYNNIQFYNNNFALYRVENPD